MEDIEERIKVYVKALEPLKHEFFGLCYKQSCWALQGSDEQTDYAYKWEGEVNREFMRTYL